MLTCPISPWTLAPYAHRWVSKLPKPHHVSRKVAAQSRRERRHAKPSEACLEGEIWQLHLQGCLQNGGLVVSHCSTGVQKSSEAGGTALHLSGQCSRKFLHQSQAVGQGLANDPRPRLPQGMTVTCSSDCISR